MMAIAYILYLGVGLVQLVAIMDGVDHLIGIGSFLSFLIALFITYIPFVGAAAGIYGAIEVWGWAWYSAAALFLGVFVVSAAIYAIARPE